MGHVVIIVGSHHNAPRIIYTHNHRHTQGSKYDDTCVREGMFVFSRLAVWLSGHTDTYKRVRYRYAAVVVVVAGNAAAV